MFYQLKIKVFDKRRACTMLNINYLYANALAWSYGLDEMVSAC